MTFEHTTSQVLFDRDGHRCIRFSSLVKGEGVQANQFLIIDQQRAAVLDPGGDLTYMPLTMELNKYTRLENLDYVMASHQDPDIITSSIDIFHNSDNVQYISNCLERVFPR